jgi:hypothetical protein
MVIYLDCKGLRSTCDESKKSVPEQGLEDLLSEITGLS